MFLKTVLFSRTGVFNNWGKTSEDFSQSFWYNNEHTRNWYIRGTGHTYCTVGYTLGYVTKLGLTLHDNVSLGLGLGLYRLYRLYGKYVTNSSLNALI